MQARTCTKLIVSQLNLFYFHLFIYILIHNPKMANDGKNKLLRGLIPPWEIPLLYKLFDNYSDIVQPQFYLGFSKLVWLLHDQDCYGLSPWINILKFKYLIDAHEFLFNDLTPKHVILLNALWLKLSVQSYNFYKLGSEISDKTWIASSPISR